MLSADGEAAPLRGGEHFCSLPEVDLAQAGAGWLVSEYCFSVDWPNWVMHLYGDEFVYLLSGAVQLHIPYPSELSIVELTGSGAVIVPLARRHGRLVLQLLRAAPKWCLEGVRASYSEDEICFQPALDVQQSPAV